MECSNVPEKGIIPLSSMEEIITLSSKKKRIPSLSKKKNIDLSQLYALYALDKEKQSKSYPL